MRNFPTYYLLYHTYKTAFVHIPRTGMSTLANFIVQDEHLELAEKIEEALNKLTEKQRTTFILRHYHNLPLQEIAGIMDCSVGTVKAQLFRTLKKLQVLLTKYQLEF